MGCFAFCFACGFDCDRCLLGWVLVACDLVLGCFETLVWFVVLGLVCL